MYIAVPRAAASSVIDPVAITSVSFIAALPVRASLLADVLRIALRWLWKCFWHFMGDISESTSVLRYCARLHVPIRAF
jgi:hypothetical protein